MNQPDLFKLEKGRALRDQGIQRAVDHAHAEHPRWVDTAIKMATDYIVAHPPQPFFMHELREVLESYGLPQPPELRAWGAIPRRLVKAGVIRAAGVYPCTKPEQHMALKTKWVRRF